MPNQEQISFSNIEELVEWLREKRPETIYRVKNQYRYSEVMNAISVICNMATSTEGVSILIPTSDEITGTSLFLEIVGDPIVFDDIEKLCTSLSKASNFEVRTQKQGKISKAYIGLVFQDVWDFALPSNK